MSRLPLPREDGGGRFPGLDVMGLAPHWDAPTTRLVAARLQVAADLRFFTHDEGAVAAALFDQLLGQRAEPRVPVLAMVEGRLAEDQTDGWHYETMPEDQQAWRDSLAGLDADAHAVVGPGFAGAGWDEQTALVRAVQQAGPRDWHGMPAVRVWSLWTRYACTAFYSHPWAWDEIGFAGPAYPRGYKNIGVDAREPFEVADHHPGLDPASGAPR